MIKKTTHFNMDAITIENDKIRVTTLPEHGFKVASIYHKEKDFEFLFQPSNKEYKKAYHGADFSKYDTSGLDDCVPSIDPCKYLDTDIDLVDHGDVWSIPWDVKHTKGKLEGEVELPSLPLLFSRAITLDEESIIFNYRVKNLSGEDVAYLWTLHGLNCYNENTRLEFPEDLRNYINVQNDEVWNFDIRNLKDYPKNHTFKYYFTDEIKEGWALLDYRDKRVKYKVNFDPRDNPYLGIWLTTGGFKEENNVAIEPCNGFYDTLERAVDNKKVKYVRANDCDFWQVKIDIIDY
ncbi:MAG: hypothetical protein GX366_06815 [Epulopiscium sp.]|nr:hypothetical protein [Candidatus Epulonipiscium sp.]